MKINITKKQYEIMMHHLEISGWVYGKLGDFVDEKYKNKYLELEDLKCYLYSFAKEFKFKYKLEEYEDKFYLKEDELDKFYNILEEYDQHTFVEELISLYIQKKIVENYSSSELEVMDYDKLDSLEDKYRKELWKAYIEKGNNVLKFDIK